LAIFNSLMTVIQQIIDPAGYTSDDAGSFGGILIGSGLVGAMIVGPVLDYTKAYKTVLKIGMPIGLVAVTCFVSQLKPDNWTLVAVFIGCLGFVTHTPPPPPASSPPYYDCGCVRFVMLPM